MGHVQCKWDALSSLSFSAYLKKNIEYMGTGAIYIYIYLHVHTVSVFCLGLNGGLDSDLYSSILREQQAQRIWAPNSWGTSIERIRWKRWYMLKEYHHLYFRLHYLRTNQLAATCSFNRVAILVGHGPVPKSTRVCFVGLLGA